MAWGKKCKIDGCDRDYYAKEYCKRHYENIRYSEIEYVKSGREKSRRQYRRSIKYKIMNHYTNGTFKCQCVNCDVVGLEWLTVEHINGNGRKHRNEVVSDGFSFYIWIVKNNFPNGLTAYCYNCNCAKRDNGGTCPHNL